MGIKIVTVAEMQAIEEAADKAGQTYDKMMEQAGYALATWATAVIAKDGPTHNHVLVLVGPGNNGGDGLVAARMLRTEFGHQAEVTAYLLAARKKSDAIFTAAKEAGVAIVEYTDDAKNDFAALHDLIGKSDIVIDAVFGIGGRLPISGNAAKLLQQVQTALDNTKAGYTSYVDPTTGPYRGTPPIVIACDCPSGLNCDTGEVDSLTLQADYTVTFAAAKPGLFIFPGAEAVGQLIVADIGLPANLPELENIRTILADGATVRNILPARKRNSHKGTFGKAMVVAGSLNYIGAAYLSGKAAYRSGAGLVTIAAAQPIIPTLAAMLPEATWVLMPHEMGVLHENAVPILREAVEKYTALLLGPGIGTEDSTKRFIEQLLQSDKPHAATVQKHIGFRFNTPEENQSAEEANQVKLPPLVIDADALNLLAQIPEWWKLLPANTILTPHPGEFARLAGIEDAEKDGPSATEQVQADRVNLAAKYAQEWNAVVVLKGAFTIVAAPDGKITILPFATSALATAGTGDVLAGVIVGLLAQGVAPVDAAVAGAWLHGYAGIETSRGYFARDLSVIASDVLEMLPSAFEAVTA